MSKSNLNKLADVPQGETEAKLLEKSEKSLKKLLKFFKDYKLLPCKLADDQAALENQVSLSQKKKP